MPIDLRVLCRDLTTAKTAILFGAGSSIPSGGLDGAALAERICTNFHVTYDPTLSLADTATLVEINRARRDLINFLRKTLLPLRPTAGLLNLPLYDWKDIFTTNFDTLIEQTYSRISKPLRVYSSNFDFDDDDSSPGTSLFKIHGTVEKDRSLGHISSLVLTAEDYDLATEYRELLLDRFLHETSRGASQ